MYVIDIKGDHRYILTWLGPRLSGPDLAHYSEYTTRLTGGVFELGRETRLQIQQGHEDDTLLKFFPNGFLCHDGPYTKLDDLLARTKANGTMYRVQGPYGETPQAIQ